MKRIDPREIEGFATAVADAVAAAPALVPLTATTTGGPELVWDDDDNLMMVEAPR